MFFIFDFPDKPHLSPAPDQGMFFDSKVKLQVGHYVNTA